MHSWFRRVEPCILYVLMEVREETDYVVHHAQKVIAIFAAMRAFADLLRGLGHDVIYLTIGDAHNAQSIPANLERLVALHGATRLEWQEPDEWRLDQVLSNWAARQAIASSRLGSEHFYTERNELAENFGHRRHAFLEVYYRRARIKEHVLVDAHGKPAGGRWNYDAENRRAWRGVPPAPGVRRGRHDHRALWGEIEAAGVTTFGQPQAASFPWPATRAEALCDLEAFIGQRLAHFGDFQDAMAEGAPELFHSLLSFALNVKLISPREVVERALEAWRDGRASLASVEGFVRQILGWREYIRGVYWMRMPGYARSNYLDAHEPLPPWYWTGETGMNCLAQAIGQSLSGAYAHHIQRLMLTGNFALLLGVEPDAIERCIRVG